MPSTSSLEMAASAGNSSPFLRSPTITLLCSPIRRAVGMPFANLPNMLPVNGLQSLGDEDVERLAQDFLPRVAENLFGTIVEERDPLLLVDGNDRVGRDRNDP